MEHLILNEGSDSAALAKVALKALREARRSKTSNSGSIFVSDGKTDDNGIALGTGTIINGVDGGVQPWVGDTTAPGKPTGITAESHNGAIWVSWDGTLEGGIPADFDHVQFTAVDGSKTVDLGQLRAAGKVTAAELTAGDTVTITAIAYDDAHDAQGNSTPNASVPSDPVTVVVQSAVDAAAVQKAQDDAQAALNQAGQAKSTADTATQTAQGAQADASNAVSTANSANNMSKTASSTAQAALTTAQSAQQGTVTKWVPQYAVNQSTTDAPTTGWSSDKPEWTAGHYIWMRTVVTYGSGDSEYSTPVLLTGNPGATGPQGPNGSDGVSVTSITPYWALGTSAPAQPTVSEPTSPWQSTEPGYSRNQHLYKTSKVTYSNGQFAYMPVVMDSSYEYSAAAESSARDAVQTATNANTTAQTAKSAADSAVSTANAASSTASTAKSTADNASSVATQANATAVSANQAATSAQTAANLALANAQEFVVNGGFETGDLTGWTASGVAVLSGFDQDYPHSGKYQARFAAGASCSQSINGLVSGHVIRCSFWQRGVDGSTATMTISFNGGDEQTVGSITGVTPYTRAFKDFTVPANTTTATIKLTCDTDYIRFDDISVKDITEAQAAQKAADDAQATADTANTTAQNATTIANAAKAAAEGAQTTADGKNKIFSSVSEPSHTGIVPGDMWFQLDANKNVSGIKVWNGSAFTDMVLLGNKLLVASSVGTTQIADNAITTGKISANAVTALQIAAQSITGDKLDVGSVAAAIIKSGLFKTSDGSYGFDSTNGFWAGDTSGMHMALTGSSSGSTNLAIMRGKYVISSLSFDDTISTDGYVHTGIYTGQGGQFLEFATLVDNVNHKPDPLSYDVRLIAAGGTGLMNIDAQHAVNVDGTWFAHYVNDLPESPEIVGGAGTRAFAGGIEYTFDGVGAWVVADALCVAIPTSESKTVNGATAVRMDTLTGDSEAYTKGSNYIQVNFSGVYLVGGSIQVSGISGGRHHANISIGVDGYSSSNKYMGKEIGGGPGLDGAWITAVYPGTPIRLSAGQKIYLMVLSDVNGATIRANGSLLSITRIGE